MFQELKKLKTEKKILYDALEKELNIIKDSHKLKTLEIENKIEKQLKSKTFMHKGEQVAQFYLQDNTNKVFLWLSENEVNCVTAKKLAYWILQQLG